jgi:hypothetical protein
MVIRMALIKVKPREPNRNSLYQEEGHKWCGFCGEPRAQNPKNRCDECGCKLRGRKRN